MRDFNKDLWLNELSRCKDYQQRKEVIYRIFRLGYELGRSDENDYMRKHETTNRW